MIATTREKKRRGLSMIVNQFSGESRNADSASLNFAKDTTAETQEIRFQKAELEIKFQNTELENLTLTTRLNVMIAAGVKFEVSADSFQTFGASERETAFLRDNRAAILCTLQQVFLQRHLFRHSKDLLEVFTVEVVERRALIADGADGEPETDFEAVCQVTKEWIREQIENL